MAQTISNPSADREEKLEHAAKLLRQSAQAKAVFKAIYQGGKQWKTIDDLRTALGKDFNTNTYKAADRLDAESIIEKKDTGGGANLYGKVSYYATNRDIILRLSENPVRLKKIPTKRKVISVGTKAAYVFRTRPQATQITVDEIASFSKVRKITQGDEALVNKMPERTINSGICNIILQKEKKDWGGEMNDIFTTKLVVKTTRVAAAFALKGQGTKGTLTPRKMGKNGDQIIRLFNGVSDIYFVVHNDTVEESIYDLMYAHATAKSVLTGKKILWCVVDLSDLARLVAAYPACFNIDEKS